MYILYFESSKPIQNNCSYNRYISVNGKQRALCDLNFQKTVMRVSIKETPIGIIYSTVVKSYGSRPSVKLPL